jgi:hypothetical protein
MIEYIKWISKMMKALSLIFAVWVFPIFFSSAQASETCPKNIKLEEWLSFASKTEQHIETSLRGLGSVDN